MEEDSPAAVLWDSYVATMLDKMLKDRHFTTHQKIKACGVIARCHAALGGGVQFWQWEHWDHSLANAMLRHGYIEIYQGRVRLHPISAD